MLLQIGVELVFTFVSGEALGGDDLMSQLLKLLLDNLMSSKVFASALSKLKVMIKTSKNGILLIFIVLSLRLLSGINLARHLHLFSSLAH